MRAPPPRMPIASRRDATFLPASTAHGGAGWMLDEHPPSARWDQTLICVCCYAMATCMYSESIWISFAAHRGARFTLDVTGEVWWELQACGDWSRHPPMGRDFRLALPNCIFSFSASGEKRTKAKRLAPTAPATARPLRAPHPWMGLHKGGGRVWLCSPRSFCSTIINLSSSFNLKSHSKRRCFIQASSKITSQAQAHTQRSLRLMESLQSELITVQTERAIQWEAVCKIWLTY